jgi:hypothetical protein
MAKNLIPLTIGAPGFLGLNTQQSGNILPMGWATKLDNFIYDDLSRIASRKGSQQVLGLGEAWTQNLLTYSEQFDHADWLDPSTTWTATANTTVAPDGTTTADTITFDTADPLIRHTVAAATGSTFSVWVQVLTGNVTDIQFDHGDGPYTSVFDQLVNGEWARLKAENMTKGVSDFIDIKIYGDIGSTVAIWGAQLTETNTLLSYSKTEATTHDTAIFRAIHEYIDTSGLKVNILAGDNKIFKEVAGVLTDISGTITTPTNDHWQFANFNGWCIGYQSGHIPIILTTTSGTFADGSGTMYNGSMVLSAYGRSWTVVGNTLYYSDLLIHNYTGGSSGNFDLAKFWPNGMDQAVALADFNGLLVVFGKESIIVYENADEVASMAIIEGINGIGCTVRDSVQVIGKEIVFLSSTGLRTLGRTIIEKSMPLTDISQHVRDDLLNNIAAETLINVKSVYNRGAGFYLLSLPTSGISYMFDLKFPNQDGTWKVSKWTIAPTALNYTEGLVMHLAVDAGHLSKYVNNIDSADYSGLNGTAFTLDFEGVWNDFGEDYANFLKIPKQVSLLGSGATGSDIVFKWALDYASNFTERYLDFTGTLPAQYGVAQYGLDVYATVGSFERVKSNLASTGQVIKIGLSTTIDGNAFALQRIDLLAKIGRIGI